MRSPVISDCRLQTTEQIFHLDIELNGNRYFFIVDVLTLVDVEKPVIRSTTRGVTYWDCGLKLRLSDKRRIKEMIENHIFNLLLWQKS